MFIYVNDHTSYVKVYKSRVRYSYLEVLNLKLESLNKSSES